jgi:O-6-methylguanine DNA methyltransferase
VVPQASGKHMHFCDTLQSIPPGQTRSYGTLAATLNTSPRAVGSLCARNRLLLRIPCHRVVAAKGPGGFRAGRAWKETLLWLERDRTVFRLFSDLSPELF